MGQYLSPGVYVEEVPSAVQPIAGVGTSTAGFIGKVPNKITVPKSSSIITDEVIGTGDGAKKIFDLKKYPVQTDDGTYEVRVDGVVKPTKKPTNDGTKKESKIELNTAPADKATVVADYIRYEEEDFNLVAGDGEVKLCTNFGEFKKFFGDFSKDAGHRNLAHAVYGFFNNGGTRCFVARVTADTGITKALEKFAAIDEIAIVAAPGITASSARSAIDSHCKNTSDRFAIFDSKELTEVAGDFDASKLDVPDNSDYAAFYIPWVKVFDPATKIQNPKDKGHQFVPPSGHMAGIYARVDTQRGVHKAPANVPVRGALGLKYYLSKAKQDGLNPQGINCIRDLNGNIRVWGARTIGGDANGEWKYINVRRLFLFLRESIDEGTQWVVFEPNSHELWSKIRRNITAFLTNVWRSGALFGTTPQEAFYVKCDGETNPPEVRDAGQVVTEIGVAVVKPAEFVIFRITQWAGPGA